MKPSMRPRWVCEGVVGRSAAGVLAVCGPQRSRKLARGIESVRCGHRQMGFSERAAEDESPGERGRWPETGAGTRSADGWKSTVNCRLDPRAVRPRCSRESPLGHRPFDRRLVHQLAFCPIRPLGDGRVSPRVPSAAVDNALCRGPR